MNGFTISPYWLLKPSVLAWLSCFYTALRICTFVLVEFRRLASILDFHSPTKRNTLRASVPNPRWITLQEDNIGFNGRARFLTRELATHTGILTSKHYQPDRRYGHPIHVAGTRTLLLATGFAAIIFQLSVKRLNPRNSFSALKIPNSASGCLRFSFKGWLLLSHLLGCLMESDFF